MTQARELFIFLRAFFSQSTSGVVFAVVGLMSRLAGGVLIVVIQNLFPKGRLLACFTLRRHAL